jgi:hypothetical protein
VAPAAWAACTKIRFHKNHQQKRAVAIAAALFLWHEDCLRFVFGAASARPLSEAGVTRSPIAGDKSTSLPRVSLQHRWRILLGSLPQSLSLFLLSAVDSE